MRLHSLESSSMLVGESQVSLMIGKQKRYLFISSQHAFIYE
ncbi:hypothetical protein J2Z82_000612 [Virgibacillus litoralis]|uniref:Uncharacterized protein n=1 Tax=Virgibacillus litoralis TaxID=578221 RepID=A0ABS4H9W1_9BACI|nr:hypothetical protein [Virgibacillus litoralis]